MGERGERAAVLLEEREGETTAVMSLPDRDKGTGVAAHGPTHTKHTAFLCLIGLF